MVSYRNIKPSIGDAVRTMFTTVNRNNTKPTGTAVLEPDEGFILRAPTGRTVTWDGEAAVQFREDLDAAENTVSAAAETLYQAEQRLEAADERLLENTTILEDADQRIINAQALAEEAKALAEQGGGTPSLDALEPGDGPVDPLVAEKLAGAVGVYDTLIVTEQAILNHATLLGTTVVEELHVTKTLRGRDAILDGTLDVAQLNVTADLSAAVVNAMDINAKNLVVTESAVLQHVTAIEGIVTPELVANRINLETLGGDLMQEAALTVAGPTGVVQLSGSGYQAWNAQGQLTVSLSGANNLITGDLQTAASGTRALISTRANTSAMDFFVGNSVDHGGVWYDGGATKTMTIGVMPDGGFNAQTSASLRFVLDGTIMQTNAIIGQSNRQQHGYYEWPSPGIPANGSSTEVTITFPQVMSENGQLYINFQPEAPSGARMTVTQTFTSSTQVKFILHNHSNFSTGRMWLWWTAVARTRWWD